MLLLCTKIRPRSVAGVCVSDWYASPWFENTAHPEPRKEAPSQKLGSFIGSQPWEWTYMNVSQHERHFIFKAFRLWCKAKASWVLNRLYTSWSRSWWRQSENWIRWRATSIINVKINGCWFELHLRVIGESQQRHVRYQTMSVNLTSTVLQLRWVSPSFDPWWSDQLVSQSRLQATLGCQYSLQLLTTDTHVTPSTWHGKGLSTTPLINVQTQCIDNRPIIGIGRLLCQYRPIVIYYVLWWRWILKLYFFYFERTIQIFVL